MQWDGPLFRSRTAEERRTPRSLLRLSAAISSGSVADGAVYSRHGKAAVSPLRRSHESPSRKLAFDDSVTPGRHHARASDDSVVLASNGNSPVSNDGSPNHSRPASAWSDHGQYGSTLPAGSPVAIVRNTPNVKVDASTCVISDETVVYNQLVDVSIHEMRQRDKILREEDLTFSARIVRRHMDDVEALRAAERAAQHRRAEEAVAKKSSKNLPHPYPDPSGLTPAKATPFKDHHGSTPTADQFLDPQFHLRWDLDLYEQSMRRRVCVRERLDRDVLVDAQKVDLDLIRMVLLEIMQREALLLEEQHERRAIATKDIEGIENVTRWTTVLALESEQFRSNIEMALEKVQRRDALFEAASARLAALDRDRYERYEDFGRDLYEPILEQLRQTEAHFRAFTEREEHSDRYFAVSMLAIEECETLSRKQDITGPQTVSWMALLQLATDTKLTATLIGAEATQRATVVATLSKERNAVVNDWCVALQGHAQQREATMRSAIVTEETTQVAVLKRGVHLLNLQAPVSRMLESCSGAHLCSRFKTWNRWLVAKKKQRALLQQRLRKMTALNGKLLPRRYFDVWTRWLSRRKQVTRLLKASQLALLRMRFGVLRRVNLVRSFTVQQRQLHDAETVARHEAEKCENEDRHVCIAQRERSGPTIQCQNDEARERRVVATTEAQEYRDVVLRPHAQMLAVKTVGDEDLARLLIETQEHCEVAVVGRVRKAVRVLPHVERLVMTNSLVLQNRYFAQWARLVQARRRAKLVRHGKVQRLAVINQKRTIRRYYAAWRRFASLRKRVATLLTTSTRHLLRSRFTTLRSFVEASTTRRRLLRDETIKTESRDRVALITQENQASLLLRETHLRAVISITSLHDFGLIKTAFARARAQFVAADEADERSVLVREEAVEFRGFARSGKKLRIAMKYETQHAAPLGVMKSQADIALAQRAMAAWRRYFSRRVQMYRQHITSMPGIAAMLAASMLEDDE